MANLFIGNDNLIRLLNTVDQSGGDDATPSAVTSATVTAQIKDSLGSDIGAAIILTHQAAGDYEGVAIDTLPLVDGDNYTIEITADDGAGRRGFWKLACTAQVRKVV